MEITLFDIPLLNNEVCQYLSRKDLAHCVLASKAWANQFSPALWRNLDCRYRIPDILTLTRRREHIRIVRHISMECESTVLEQLAFLRLQRLEFNKLSGGTSQKEIQVLHVLERIPTLQHLQISLTLDCNTMSQQWARTMEALPCMESLTLTCHRLVSGIVFQNVLQSCRGLQRLALELMEDGNELERQEYKDVRAAIERMPEMHFCELILDSDREAVFENIFRPLLERCPRMEKLCLGKMCNGPTLTHLAKTLHENKLPKLRYLALTDDSGDQVEKVLGEVLSYIACGLDGFIPGGYDCSVIAPPLIQYHARSLTRLDMLDSPMSLWTFSDLMAGLPCLRTVRAIISEDLQDDDDILPLDKDWKCLGLRSLQLELEISVSCYSIDDDEWEGSTEKGYLDHVFSQVAKLESLGELCLGCGLDMFCKKFGYLKQLAGLKQLKVLDLSKAAHSNFGKQHALWMAMNWPKLLQVRGQDLPVMFKRTLLKRRPLVEFVNE
ncbi:hypothetical protein BGX34_002457 [Mortierella sp. NVP85]|nr:hypothetical protein BGX34_002457 [Mortierella sp. NVP85]